MSEPSQMYEATPPLLQQGDALLVHEAAQQSPIKCLQEAASTVLELITVAKVGTQRIISGITHTDLLDFKGKLDKGRRGSFDSLVHGAVALTAVIWRSYLTSNTQRQWPSQEQLNSITDFALYVPVFLLTLSILNSDIFEGFCSL